MAGYVQVLANMNKVAVNLCVGFNVGISFQLIQINIKEFAGKVYLSWEFFFVQRLFIDSDVY